MGDWGYVTGRDVICWAHGLMLGAAFGVPIGLAISWIT